LLALAGFAAGVEYSISALTGDGEVLAAIACGSDGRHARLQMLVFWARPPYFGRSTELAD